MPLGMSYAEKALKLDEHSAEAHTSRAYCLFHFHRDWIAAEQEFRRAIELNPNYPAVHHWYSHFLTARGRTDESLDESKHALELDPLDMLMNVHLAWHYQLAGQFDEALKAVNPIRPHGTGLALVSFLPWLGLRTKITDE